MCLAHVAQSVRLSKPAGCPQASRHALHNSFPAPVVEKEILLALLRVVMVMMGVHAVILVVKVIVVCDVLGKKGY